MDQEQVFILENKDGQGERERYEGGGRHLEVCRWGSCQQGAWRMEGAMQLT